MPPTRFEVRTDDGRVLRFRTTAGAARALFHLRSHDPRISALVGAQRRRPSAGELRAIADDVRRLGQRGQATPGRSAARPAA